MQISFGDCKSSLNVIATFKSRAAILIFILIYKFILI